ncbi:MAG TPA: hypothetical protein VIO94_13380 [Phenylobacterium sp.]
MRWIIVSSAVLFGASAAGCASSSPDTEQDQVSPLKDVCLAGNWEVSAPSTFERGAKFAGPVAFVGRGGEVCVDIRKEPAFRDVNDPIVPADDARALLLVQLAGVRFPTEKPAREDARLLLTMNVAGNIMTCISLGRRERGAVVARCSIEGEPMDKRIGIQGLPIPGEK